MVGSAHAWAKGPTMSEELPIVDVGPVAHGGHCVARLDGQVVFVRHTLPGERVRIRVTDRSKRFLRADAVEVLEAAPGRVAPPCRYAGQCGGCDFQHVDPEAQLDLLTSVVSEQLQRLAGVEWDGRVESVGDSLGWRTRVTFAIDATGRPGLRAHRSHEVVPVEECLIAHPDLPDVLGQRWDTGPVEGVVASTGESLVVTDASVPRGLADGVVGTDGQVRHGRRAVHEEVRDRRFRVTGSGFWQVHPASATTLVDAVLAGADLRPGDHAADLYAGVGLFTAFLAQDVGPEGRVASVESDPGGSRDARRNLHDLAQVQLIDRTTERSLRDGSLVGSLDGRVDVVVLDPPRTGAKRAIADIVELRPRRIVYVACDPAALARDLVAPLAAGYKLVSLRGFALFPMTHHVECVAVLALP